MRAPQIPEIQMIKPSFQALPGIEGVFVVRTGKLWCTAIRLGGKKLCLYSPSPGLRSDAVERLHGLAAVSFLLAPNHYHTRGIAECQRLFPDADLVCSDAAKPRLSKVTGIEFSSLSKLSNKLPRHVQILEPKGLKTGEIWFEIEYANERVWVVTDAFTSVPVKSKAFTETPSMLGTFPKFGVRDPTLYASWVKQKLSDRPPTILIPCHGPPVKRPNLAVSLSELVDRNF